MKLLLFLGNSNPALLGHITRYQLRFILFFGLSVLSLVASAQSKIWDKTYGGRGSEQLSSMLPTRDGGYILGGWSGSGKSGNKTQSGKGGTDYWLVKLNADGTKAWDKTYGGGLSEYHVVIQQTTDGGYIVGGTSESLISGDKTETYRGRSDFWILKLDASGNKIWDKTLGGNNFDNFVSLQQTRDGGFILGGFSSSGKSGDKSDATRGGRDYWVIKLKADGSKEWDKTLGSNNDDQLATVQQTPDGGYLLGGTSSSPVGGNKTAPSQGEEDYWIVKLNPDGSRAWDKTIGGKYKDELSVLLLTTDGGYLLGGSSISGIGGDKSQPRREAPNDPDYKNYADYWVVKLKADGSKEWDKTLGGFQGDNLRAMQQTPDGGYLLGGTSNSTSSGEKTEISQGNSDYWLVQLKANGTKSWDKTIGGDGYDNVAALLVTSTGDYIVGGITSSGKSGDKSENLIGNDDYWVVKLEAKTVNAVAWNLRYGALDNDNLTAAIATADGGYLAGGYSNSDQGYEKSANSRGLNDYWLVKTDAFGSLLWDKTYGGNAHDYLNAIVQTADGGYLLGGSSFSGNNGDKTEASRGDRDFWVIKTDAQGNKQWDQRFGGSGSDELKKVILLASGEYLLGGSSNSPVSGDKTQGSQGAQDYWLVKISATGTKIWDQRYGGPLDENLHSFIQTPDGGFLLTGSSWSGQSGDKSQASLGSSDFWVVKIAANGVKLWDKTYGGTGEDISYSVDSSGPDYFVAGTSNSGKNGDLSQAGPGGKDYWLVKISATGSKLWDKRFGGLQDDEFRAGALTPDGGYALAGHSFSGAGGAKTQSNQGRSDYWVVQVDATGKQQGDKRFGGSRSEELRALVSTDDGGFLLAGRSDSEASGDKSQSLVGFTGYDYWLVKVPPFPTLTTAVRTTTFPEEPVRLTDKVVMYPNPFQDRVTIRFSLPQTQLVSVKVYDTQGQEVSILFQGQAQAQQTYQVTWNARNQAAGLYFLHLQTPTGPGQRQKMLLTK